MEKIDKIQELNLLDTKRKELEKLNTDISNIIDGLRNDIDLSDEGKLIAENKVQAAEISKLYNKIKENESTIKNLQDEKNTILDELKNLKNQKRKETVSIFDKLMMKTINENFELKMTEKLSNYQKSLLSKIDNIKKELPKSNIEKAAQIRNKLNEVEKEAEEIVRSEKVKILDTKQQLVQEKDIFTKEVEAQYQGNAGEYLYEKEKKNFSVEKLIGLKGFQIGGLIAIFTAVVILFREQIMALLNYKYGKSVFCYLLGIAFIGIGEFLYRKKRKSFAVGMIGGGIGILYIATILSSTYLKLYPLNTGLILSAILTALTVILSFKYDSQMIGLITLIGGHIPYATCITLNGSYSTTVLAIYSLLLQVVVLAVSWHKNWKVSRITGFVLGTFNMIFLMTYMYVDKVNVYIQYAYLIIFTGMYVFAFLTGAEKDHRKEKRIDIFLLGIDLAVELIGITMLAQIYRLSVVKRSMIFMILGLIYLILADRTKRYKLSRAFILMGLACFIIVIPVLVAPEYLPIAWGLETILIYLLGKKEKTLSYGAFILYCVTVTANYFIYSKGMYTIGSIFNVFAISFFRNIARYIGVLDVPRWVWFADQIMVLGLSYGLYSINIRNNVTGRKNILNKILKYITLTSSVLTFASAITLIDKKLTMWILEKYSTKYEFIPNKMFLWAVIVIVSIFVIRMLTYKLKKYYDEISLPYISLLEIIFTVLTLAAIPINRVNSALFELPIVVILLGYLFITLREDLHKAIFKTKSKNIQWVIMESIYIICVSYIVLGAYNISLRQFIVDIIGVLLCVELVWRGFNIPNRNLRRIGLIIGTIFTLKGFAIDFIFLAPNYRVLGYFITGILLLVTSYIYQIALKKLDSSAINKDNNTDSENKKTLDKEMGNETFDEENKK